MNPFDLKNLEENGFVMPALFIGHGSPMNGIENNQFTEGWKKSIENLPLPKAIICISAHWETNGVKITAQPKPKTIHDFYGFPQELFAVQYPAPGSRQLAEEIAEKLKDRLIELDESWGFDHGTWTVIRHLYPRADPPVLQLSLNRLMPPIDHYRLGAALNHVRRKGVLIIGSGNMVHNLRMVNFRQENGYDWAEKANETFKKLILEVRHRELIDFRDLGSEANLSIPTPEHYLPLLYILGLQEKTDKIEIFNDAVELGSLSMTSVKIS